MTNKTVAWSQLKQSSDLSPTGVKSETVVNICGLSSLQYELLPHNKISPSPPLL